MRVVFGLVLSVVLSVEVHAEQDQVIADRVVVTQDGDVRVDGHRIECDEFQREVLRRHSGQLVRLRGARVDEGVATQAGRRITRAAFIVEEILYPPEKTLAGWVLRGDAPDGAGELLLRTSDRTYRLVVDVAPPSRQYVTVVGRPIPSEGRRTLLVERHEVDSVKSSTGKFSSLRGEVVWSTTDQRHVLRTLGRDRYYSLYDLVAEPGLLPPLWRLCGIESLVVAVDGIAVPGDRERKFALIVETATNVRREVLRGSVVSEGGVLQTQRESFDLHVAEIDDDEHAPHGSQQSRLEGVLQRLAGTRVEVSGWSIRGRCKNLVVQAIHARMPNTTEPLRVVAATPEGTLVLSRDGQDRPQLAQLEKLDFIPAPQEATGAKGLVGGVPQGQEE